MHELKKLTLMTLLAITLVSAIAVCANLIKELRVPSRGVVKVVGIQLLNATTNQPITEINWGLISPDDEKSISAIVHNNGSLPVTLSLSTINWNPIEASGYMTLTWNYSDGRVINPKERLPVTFTLRVSTTATNITDFSFTIVIRATSGA